MPYRRNINYILFRDRNSELLFGLDRLLNMSCMESGQDIHLERTTGCQSSVPRLDATNNELLTQVGPTASNIAKGNLSTHERWPLKHSVY